MMLEVGQDSTYHEETGTFIEAVSMTLARFPPGWEGRTTREVHDLTVAKLAIGRDKDLEFFQGVIDLKLVDKDKLKERYRKVPGTEQDRIVEGLAQIDEGFHRSARGPGGEVRRTSGR